jgi:AraC-like DNA-binding protein
MSRSNFAARFTATVGIAPIDYLLRWRIALAKDALRNGRLKLAEVAELIGYNSASAFSLAFSRTVGCSPSAFAAGDQPAAPLNP